MSINSTDPKILFGGTWERLKGGFLYGAVESYGVGNSTGTKTNASSGNTGSTTLTIDQIPSHNHYDGTNGTEGIAASGGVASAIVYWNASSGRPTTNTGGGKGHTHTLNSHTHNIPYMAVFIWKRTA